MLSLNNTHVQHFKIYLPCNFKVNLITHLEVIALFSSNFKNINTCHPLFQKLLEIDVKCKLQTCSAFQDLPTLQFLSKSEYLFWSNCPFLYLLSFISKTIRDRC